MSYSTVTYTGNGATTNFAVPFPYLAQSDVNVQVNGATPTFSWLNSTTIQITPAPANGATVYLYRSTSLTTLPVTFADASMLRAADLNSDFTQVLYLAQDAWDQTSTYINNARVQSGLLPVVTTANNGNFLTVQAGAWAVSTLSASILRDASLTVVSGNLSVSLNANGGIQQVGNGLECKLRDSSFVVGGLGVGVNLAASGGLQINSGLLARGSQIVAGNPGSPADGDRWYDSTNKSFKRFEGTQNVWDVGTVYVATAASAAIVNTASLTAANVAWNAPANFLVSGRTFRVRFGGNWASAGVAVNLAIDLFANGTSNAFDGFTFALGTQSSGRYNAELDITILTTGSSGTAVVTGYVTCEANGTVTTQALGQNSVTINTTIINSVNPAFQWGTANASNSVVVRYMSVEALT